MSLGSIGNSVSGPNGQPNVVKEKEVPVQFNRMYAAIEQLEACIPRLADVLTPVLRVEPPKDTGNEGRAPLTTPLADGIARCVDRVDNVAYALREIIDRVEL